MKMENSSIPYIENIDVFNKHIEEAKGGLVVVHFSAPWAEQSKHMNEVLTELSHDSKFSNVSFVAVDAEQVADASYKYEVVAAPTFIFIQSGELVDRVDGANVAELTSKVNKHSSTLTSQTRTKEDLNERLKKLINSASCMLFMKGNPTTPRCGFSRQITQILGELNVKYSTFDILEDDEVRQGLKAYSEWPTYPQLYSNGELLGGLDIVKEMVESGEIKDALPQKEDLNIRLKKLISQSPLVLFMKGNASTPRCGFSKTMIGILDEAGLPYTTFDILSDNEVREGLKKFSNWPTYPQLYKGGELLGGLDVIKEMKESGELMDELKS